MTLDLVLSHLKDGGHITWAGGFPRLRNAAGRVTPLAADDVRQLYHRGLVRFARPTRLDPLARCPDLDDLVYAGATATEVRP